MAHTPVTSPTQFQMLTVADFANAAEAYYKQHVPLMNCALQIQSAAATGGTLSIYHSFDEVNWVLWDEVDFTVEGKFVPLESAWWRFLKLRSTAECDVFFFSNEDRRGVT